MLGGAVDPLDQPADEDALASLGDGLPGLLFIQVPEANSVKNWIHLDLQPQDRTRDEEIARLIELGATPYDDWRTPNGRGWMVLSDPGL